MLRQPAKPRNSAVHFQERGQHELERHKDLLGVSLLKENYKPGIFVMPASESRLFTEVTERLSRVSAHRLTLISKGKHVRFTLSRFFHTLSSPVDPTVQTRNHIMVCPHWEPGRTPQLSDKLVLSLSCFPVGCPSEVLPAHSWSSPPTPARVRHSCPACTSAFLKTHIPWLSEHLCLLYILEPSPSNTEPRGSLKGGRACRDFGRRGSRGWQCLKGGGRERFCQTCPGWTGRWKPRMIFTLLVPAGPTLIQTTCYSLHFCPVWGICGIQETR